MNSRRTFLKQALTSTLGATLLPNTLFSMDISSSKYLETIGLQLWTIRNEIIENPDKVLRLLNNLGYKQLEGMNIPQVMDLKEKASANNLAIKSSFFQWTYLTNNWELANKKGIRKIEGINNFDALLELAHENGLSNLTFGYLFEEERSVEHFKKWAEALNIAGEKCKSAGITLSYHNHQFEFIEEDNITPFEILENRLDPSFVKFELDIFWLRAAGYDPLKMMRKLDSRVDLIHLKNIKSTTNYLHQSITNDQFVTLGNGIIDINKIVKQAAKQGVKYCFVEQDHSDQPLESIKESIEWLKRNN
ncbi:sugar phosphate isomerase/epimerase family protein [Flammeovirga kamogawensis]|uniref:Sugar phosphate isomerase/epimerase n=1 Tax=Flammeovirga kamogawensis TaxID=373891 RepID=A0ABX8H058_9BACT|nr:sugar phosphate isomerase/epimerase family protein [Flammeovirga kamogawensis]MBB6459423.1 sugar phosphate isomerase/epimerase [Flammeovirga kamogawensis]QWG08978.1 sugar phosphate isomerase/epimerase [Flammeovirga kamogawensis]